MMFTRYVSTALATPMMFTRYASTALANAVALDRVKVFALEFVCYFNLKKNSFV